MQRRTFSLPGLSVLLMLAVGSSVVGSASAQSASPRQTKELSAGWRFAKGDVPNAADPAFNASAWSTVTVPHAWTNEDGSHATYYRGPAWYRLELPITEAPAQTGKSYFLRFGAASLVADVYVNGNLVGTHKGGYSAFCFDVTSFLRPGANFLAVKVNNVLNSDVAPISGDFTIFGGLYRPVELLTLSNVSISPLDDASPGVYLTPTVNADGSGTLKVVAKLRNATAAPTPVSITTTLRDAAGQAVATVTTSQDLGPSATSDATQTVTVPSPHLWAGRADPYLYSATVEVAQDSRPVDRVTQSLGFRSFRIDPERGFFLNGKPYPLYGVNMHQGRLGTGYADTPAMVAEDFALIHELGATSVRMAHYQHSDEAHAQADKYGILTWSELALVNKMVDSPAFKETTRQQLRELIKQSYNHPAIFVWSLYNEPWVNPTAGTEQQWRLVHDLVQLAHEIDPTRPTTGAAVEGVNGPLTFYPDITALNRYWGWYKGSPSEWGPQLQKIRAQFPGKSLGIGEYGGGASAHHHELNPIPAKPASHWHPEEWQAIIHEGAWPALRDAEWLWCRYVWVMFDFDSAGRDEGDTAGINDKGLVTGDRKIKKDAFYYYKANWSEEPVVYITSRRMTERPAGPTTLKVYSNARAVTLSLNGQPLPNPTQNGVVWTWQTTLPQGEIKLAARTDKDLTDEVAFQSTTTATTRFSTMPK